MVLIISRKHILRNKIPDEDEGYNQVIDEINQIVFKGNTGNKIIKGKNVYFYPRLEVHYKKEHLLEQIEEDNQKRLIYEKEQNRMRQERNNLKLEDENEGFYKDLIKRLYENLCSFSHLDIIHLKISVLDDSSRINLTINPHVEVLNDYMLVFAVMLRTLLEIFAYILTIDDELFKEKYLKIVDITNNHDDYIKL